MSTKTKQNTKTTKTNVVGKAQVSKPTTKLATNVAKATPNWVVQAAQVRAKAAVKAVRGCFTCGRQGHYAAECTSALAKPQARATVTTRAAVEGESEGVDHGDGFRHGAARHMGKTSRLINGESVSCDRWVGQERIESLQADGTTPLGQVIGQFRLNPDAFGSRLPAIAMNYSNFQFNSAKCKLKSAVTGYADCGLLYLGYQADSDAAAPPAGDEALNDISTWMLDNKYSVKIESVTKNMELNGELVEAANELFIRNTGENRWSDQGTFLVINGGVTDLTTNAPAVISHMFVEYDIELYNVNTNTQTASCVAGYGSSNLVPQASSPFVALNGNGVIPNPDGSGNPLLTQWVGDTDVVQNVSYAETGGSLLFLPGLYVVEIEQVYGATSAPVISTASQPMILVSGTVDRITVGPLTSAATAFTCENYFTTSSLVFGMNWHGATLVAGSPSAAYTGYHQKCAFLVRETAIFNVFSNSATCTGSPPTFSFFAMSVVISRVADQIDVFRGSPSAVIDGDVVMSPKATAQLGVLKRAAARNAITPEIKLALMKGILECDATEAVYCNTLIDCFKLPMAPLRIGAQPMHPGLSILLWLVKKFGPALAARALGVVTSTLEKWIHDAEKKD